MNETQKCHCFGTTGQGVDYGPDDHCPDCRGTGFVPVPTG